MSCDKVPIRNVSFNESPVATDISVQTVLGDFTNIKRYIENRDISLLDFFRSPNINENYIDPNWCDGADATARFNELSIDDPVSCYDYIQYGGCESDYPEIFFSDIKDDRGRSIPLDLEQGIPLITLGIDTAIADSMYVDTERVSPEDETVQGSPMFYRNDVNEFLNKHILNVKTGLEQGDTVYEDVQFRIKVTASLGYDYLTKREVYYEPTNSQITLFGIIASVPWGVIGADRLQSWLLDKGEKPFTEKAGEFLLDILKKLGGQALAELVFLLSVAVSIAGFFDFLFDIGMNTDTLKYPLGGWHHYFNSTGGVYNNFDVRNSGLKYSIGNINTPEFDIDNSWTAKDNEFLTPVYNFNLPHYEYISGLLDTNIILSNVTLSGSNYYNVAGASGSIKVSFTADYAQTYRIRYDVVNSNASGSVTDDAIDNNTLVGGVYISQLISPDASGSIEARTKAYSKTSYFSIYISSEFDGYINSIRVEPFYDVYPGSKDIDTGDNTINFKNGYHIFDYEPRGRNFDRTIPPPPTVYVCELVPINNCQLSTTKTTKFLVVTAPDKYVSPEFDVIPKNTIHHGQLVKFQDALYADYLAFKDMDKPKLLGQYHHFVVNNLGNYPYPDLFVPIRGKDIIEKVETIFRTNDGYYQVIFAKEQELTYTQQVFNRHFIDRSDSYNENQIAPLYWEHDGNWKFYGGAVYMKSLGNPIKQSLGYLTRTVNYHRLYLIQIEVVNMSSGYAYIDANGTFEYDLYKKYAKSIFGNTTSEDINPGDTEWPANVEIVSNEIRLKANGFYSLIVKTRSSTFTDNSIKLNGSSTFDGGYSYCTIRRMHWDEALEHLVPLAVFNLNVSDDYLPNVLKLHYMPITFNNVDDDYLIITIGNFDYETEITVEWGDGTSTTNSILQNSTYGFYHIYDKSTEGRSFIVNVSVNNNAYIPYIKIENTNVFYLEDPSSVLYDSEVILANCGFIPTVPVDGSEVKSVLSQFYRVKKLDLSNNPLGDDLYELGNVSEYVDFSNTNIKGDLSELVGTTTYINVNNSNISHYSSLPDLRCKNVYWQDTKTIMSVGDLNYLIRDLYNSSVQNGNLYIAGTNPDITDDQILWYIFQLVHEANWTVVYNGYYVTSENRDNYIATGEDDYVYTK